MEQRTKIVATLGPASEQPAVLEAMLRAGVNVVRLNLSHGNPDEHLARQQVVRQVAERCGLTIAVLADLPGPKVRAGQIPDGGVVLQVGGSLLLTPGDGPSSGAHLDVDYPTLLNDLQPGDRVVLGDGAIELRVEHVSPDAVRSVCLTGGRIQGRPGVHLPAERLRMLAPTAEDLALAAMFAEAEVDFLALSFVRSADDLRTLRAGVDRPIRIVAKIETLQAVQALEEIADEADAVMVARGDLGIECPLEDVPHLQKKIIRHCVEAGVPVITATQMLESMITAPSPTRAEVSDVANAVFDGTDALMLSAETAVGAHPVSVITAMARIARRAEAEANYPQWAERLGRVQRQHLPDNVERITMAITHAAEQAASDAGAAAIICCTRSGRTAKSMARFRPPARLLAASPSETTVRALSLSWGVTSFLVHTSAHTDDMVWHAVEAAVRRGDVHPGDTVAVLAGAPDRPSGAATDVLRIVKVE
jgi:pyruvate kinase